MTSRARVGLFAVGLFISTVLVGIGDAAVAVPPPHASIAVTPDHGPAASTAHVSGEKFAGNEMVDIFFDTTDVGDAQARRQDFTDVAIQVPAGATPGTHTISAVGRHSRFTANASFVVTAPATAAGWPQFHNGVRHTGYNSAETVLNSANVAGLTEKWAT